MCPADRILFDLREMCGIERDINLLVASIAAKKLASGAKIVLVDVKYGGASVIKDYKKAVKAAKLLKYVFNKCGVKSIIVITNTLQTIGECVGNAAEVVDAVDVLRGKKCLLRDVSVRYAVEMILTAKPKLSRKDVEQMVCSTLDNGNAYRRFLQIVAEQGGDVTAITQNKLLQPYNTINFVADRDGYVGDIHSVTLGELIRRLCKTSHDANIGAVLRVKIGDYIKKGDTIITFYYKDQEDFEKYQKAIAGCVRVTNTKITPAKVIMKVMR